MIECPHCLLSVFPSDGICPSCQKDVNKRPTFDRVTLTVSTLTNFEPNCHRCNLPTSRMQKAKKWSKIEHEREVDTLFPLRVLFSLLSILFLPFTLVSIFLKFSFHKSSTSYDKLVLKVPTCEQCKREGIEIVDYDMQRNEFKIVVDRTFAQRHKDQKQYDELLGR